MAAAVVLGATGLVIGALWAATDRSQSPSTAAELEALRESSAARATQPATGAPSPASPALCRTLRTTATARVRDAGLTELSGLVRSRRSPGLLWAIQDSGAAPELVALQASGALAARVTLAGAQNTDWEDLATGPGPGGVPWLYAADIGDNAAQRASLTIYRVAEPAATSAALTSTAQALQLTYPDGAHDAESFLVDPRRGTLIIVTKGAPGAVYAAARPSTWSGEVRLRRIGDTAVAYATAGDVSANGRIVVVRGYFSLSIWQRRGNEPLTTTLRRRPCTSPTALADGQGEAIALSADGRTAWTVAEGSRPPIERLAPR